jgi:tetratricopeptide (TPR) repeat protein
MGGMMTPVKLICHALLLGSLFGCAILGSDSKLKQVVEFENKVKAAEQAYAEGNLPLAESLFLETSKLNPQDSTSLYRLGTISYRTGDTKKAAGYFEKVVELDPRNSKAQFNLATIRLLQAETHFKYYIATADPKANIDNLSKLIGSIEEYASENKNK